MILKAESRLVLKQKFLEDAPKVIIEELIKGPGSKNLLPTIPNGTKIISVKRKLNIVFINLSEDFVENHGGGSSGEEITVYSIVNSLTELKDVGEVQFLIEGKKLEEYKGHLVFDKPFRRNGCLIEKESHWELSYLIKQKALFYGGYLQLVFKRNFYG